ncbi:SSI family serine proteinase inhibitor [Streptomyces sp. NPDC126503]|uniref:SSI family serine proteinase inhibitor n=1 Tax=Streptomyces sp. NPDC126503 TaxID=3155315 RepID=UPI00332F171C
MRTFTAALSRAALAAALTLVCAATASPVSAPSRTGNAHIWLTVTRTTAEGVALTGEAWLVCPGQGNIGHHPHRESACTEVDTADGDFDALPGLGSAFCSNDVVGVVATAHGSYEGRPVRWERAYTSDCHLALATGHVFDFPTEPSRTSVL